MSAVVGAETPLVDAAKRGDTETVRRLLARGANANQPYGDGTTALHWAAYRNSLELTTILIGAGANVNAVTDLGVTPLWLASTEADEALVQRLLEAGANPNASLPSGETPLMGAARVGRAGAVAALLSKGAQVNAREQSRGQTALMWAASQGHAAVIRLLTQAGADVGARTTNFPTLVNVKPQGFTNSGARAGLSVQAFEDRRGVRANTGSARTQRAAGGGGGADDADASGVVSVEYRRLHAAPLCGTTGWRGCRARARRRPGERQRHGARRYECSGGCGPQRSRVAGGAAARARRGRQCGRRGIHRPAHGRPS